MFERCDEPITISAASSRSASAWSPAAGDSSETSCMRRSGTDGRCSRIWSKVDSATSRTSVSYSLSENRLDSFPYGCT